MRVGFLGAGLIATFHSKMLRASGEEVERVGVYDPDRARAEAFVAAAGGVVAGTEEEVLDGCDAVYVCTWTAEHPRLVASAAERGLAVFCEKPLAVDAPTARSMADVVEQAGITNQVGLVLRRSPAFTVLRQLAAEEESGRLMHVVFRDDQFIPVRGHYGSTWRGDASKAGAGTLIEHSIHDIDMLEWVCGPIATVAAAKSNFHGLDGIEDVVAATLSFANGATANLTSVWHDIDSRPSLRRVEVFCERALFTLEGDWFGPVHAQRSDGSTTTLRDDELVALAADVHGGEPELNPDGAFIRAARDRRPADPDFRSAVRAHEVVDAIYEAASDVSRGWVSPG